MWYKDLKMKVKEHIIDIKLKCNWPQIEEHSDSRSQNNIQIDMQGEPQQKGGIGSCK